jgi:hydrogenase/urease accessory protein HupE
VRKYLLQFFALIFMTVTLVASASAHEFDSLGILVRHKANNVALIAAPPLTAFEINEKGEKINFDSNGDGQISFEEIRVFEDEIAERVEQLVDFRDERGRAAKLKSFRLLEKGYENLLKIAESDNKNTSKSTQNKQENGTAVYIQLSLKFEWDDEPQSIRFHYGLLTDDDKHVLVRDQNIGQSQVLVLASSEPNMTIFPITGDTNANTKAIWVLGIEHVLGGLDHLLFILALTLVCKSAVGLIVPLSAFTIAHSLSLVLVALGVEIDVPSRLIETGIAMTIVIMALFDLLDWKPNRLYLVTMIMGIIHGFGLGQALTDSMGGIEGWVTALVQVTLGIELTQLAIALIFLAILINLPKLVKVSKKKLEFCISSIVVCVGFFWAMERALI